MNLILGGTVPLWPQSRKPKERSAEVAKNPNIFFTEAEVQILKKYSGKNSRTGWKSLLE